MQVIAGKLHRPPPAVEMCFDCTGTRIALILSPAYFGQFHGLREGTLIAAFGVGKILALYDPLKPAVLRFLRGAQAQ